MNGSYLRRSEEKKKEDIREENKPTRPKESSDASDAYVLMQ